MLKLKVNLAIYPRHAVYQFRLLHPEFKMNSDVGPSHDYHTKNGFIISSSFQPGVTRGYISLPGCPNWQLSDDRLSIISFDNEAQKMQFVKEVEDALIDWAHNWEGWSEEAKREEGLKIDVQFFS